MKKRLFFALLLFICSFQAYSQSLLSVDAPTVVEVGEEFHVTFVAQGKKVEDFSWECSQDFSVKWGPVTQRSTNVNILNGKRTSSVSVSYIYVLEALREGTFTLPSATAIIGGEGSSSSPVTIEVVASSSSRGEAASQDSQGVSAEDVFLKFSVDRTDVTVGQPIIATLKLYTNVDLNGLEDFTFPTLDGFWSQEIEAPQTIDFKRENIGGKLYQSALIRRYMLIPQQSGILTVDPAEMVVVVLVRNSSHGVSSIFDSFFDSYQPVRKRLRTSPVSVNVRSLPSGAPSSFGGGVGSFGMKVSLSSQSLKQHEAASLIVEISGEGNLGLITPPKVSLPADFEVYDMKSSESSGASSAMSGVRKYEYPFIPRGAGTYTVPSVEYSYYDIKQGKYVTLSSGTLEVTVDKSDDFAAGGSFVPGGKQSVKNLNEDIRYISTSGISLTERGHFFIASAAFYVIVAVILLMSAAAVFFGRKIIRRNSDIQGIRTRKATKMAHKRLKEAGVYLKGNLQGAFYEELHKAMLGYVSDKLSIKAMDMTKDNIISSLVERGATRQSAESFTSVVEACEQARYSPVSDSDAMQNNYNSAIKVISEIDGMIKSGKSSKSKVVAVVLTALLMSASWAFASTPEQLLEMANESYASGMWEESAAYYEELLASGVEAPQVYYNLGNAYFKAGRLSGAILNYERALKLDPSFEDAVNNLTLARQFTSDRIEQVPEFILATWMKSVKRSLSSDAWAILFLAVLCLMACAAVTFLLAAGHQRLRKAMFIALIPLLLAAVFSLSFSLSLRADSLSQDAAIMTAAVSSVKSSPSDSNTTSLFIIHEGTKVRILENVGRWTKIEIADGRQGWVESEDFEVI